MLKYNHSRLIQRIDDLAKLSESRLALSKEDKIGRDQLCKWMRNCNMEIQVDSIGNIFAIRKGKSDRQIMVGSHIDTVKNAGKYDGILGVLSGLEIVETLNENDILTDKSFVVASFTNEEGIRYTPDMMGSLFLSGGIDIQDVYSKKSDEGIFLKDDLEQIGYKGNDRFDTSLVDLFLELHIEQGPVLEVENLDLGLVEGVQGIYWAKIEIIGTANHAGTTPMHLRKDAFLIASRIAHYVNQLSLDIPNQLATIGQFDLKPNAINIVPARVTMTVDLRNPDSTNLKTAIFDLKHCINELAEQSNLEINLSELVHFEPVKFDQTVLSEFESIIVNNEYSYRRMISGAGHDAQMMARIVPSAMLFIPSQKGISHNPAEYSSPEQIKKGLDVFGQLIENKLGVVQ